MSTVNKITENYRVLVYYEDDASGHVQLPSDTQVATDNHNWVGWIDFQEYEKGVALGINLTGVGAWSLFRVISNTTQAGAGTDHAVKTLTTPGNINAAAETALLEWTASDITDGDRYITVDVTTAQADPLLVVYVLENRRYKRTGLTTATETAST